VNGNYKILLCLCVLCASVVKESLAAPRWRLHDKGPPAWPEGLANCTGRLGLS
jgi:hypothetical protein